MLLSMSYLHMKDIYVIHLGRQMRLLFILTQSGGRWTELVDFRPLAEGDARVHVTCEQKQRCTPPCYFTYASITHILGFAIFK